MYFFDMKLKIVEDRYVGDFDQNLEHTVTGQVCFYFRLLSRIGGVILLFILNAVMIRLFRQRMIQVSAATSTEQKEKRKVAEKALLWINIYQACLMLLNQIPHVTWQILLFSMPPAFELCE